MLQIKQKDADQFLKSIGQDELDKTDSKKSYGKNVLNKDIEYNKQCGYPISIDLQKYGLGQTEYVFQACLDFILIPYVRQTSYAKNIANNIANPNVVQAKRYNINQKLLAQYLLAYGKGRVQQYPLRLSLIIGFKSKKKKCADADNCVKAVKDALQYAGIIYDDCLKYIIGYDKIAFEFDRNFVWVGLKTDG